MQPAPHVSMVNVFITQRMPFLMLLYTVIFCEYSGSRSLGNIYAALSGFCCCCLTINTRHAHLSSLSDAVFSCTCFYTVLTITHVYICPLFCLFDVCCMYAPSDLGKNSWLAIFGSSWGKPQVLTFVSPPS